VHKAFCKNVQAQEKLKQSVSPNIVERVTRLRKLVEDFHRAHTHIIEEAMACAIETAPSPIQFFKQHMQISLAYRSDRDDNPSTSFQIKSASLKDNSEAGMLSMHLNTVFLPMVEQTHREDHVGQKGYMGTIVICCEHLSPPCKHLFLTQLWLDLVDTMPTFLTAKTIYDSHVPSWPSDRRREWFFSLAYFVERGLIFRECDPYHHRRCKPGVMEKQGSKWVWKEKSLEELKAYDIHLGCKPI
jgi:hypothetical protein